MKCLCFRWSLWLEPPSATEHAQFKRPYTRRAETGSGTKRESLIVMADINTRYSKRERDYLCTRNKYTTSLTYTRVHML